MQASEKHRHPLFYFADGSAIFQIEQTLYCLHASLLQPTSIVIKNMFAMPMSSADKVTDGVSQHQEGLSDNKPIFLGAPLTVKKFDDLLSWFYRFGNPEPTIDALESILELATFLEMDQARNFAIASLSAPQRSLPAALRLSLALNFRVSEWISPAFRELLATPANKLPFEDYVLLSPAISHLISATQAAIRTHRLVVAYNPLKANFHDPTCKSPILVCQENWEFAWWDGLARVYLHPDNAASPSDVLSRLELKDIAGVTPACRLQAVSIMKAQGVLEREEDMIQDALNEVMQMEGLVYRP